MNWIISEMNYCDFCCEDNLHIISEIIGNIRLYSCSECIKIPIKKRVPLPDYSQQDILGLLVNTPEGRRIARDEFNKFDIKGAIDFMIKHTTPENLDNLAKLFKRAFPNEFEDSK